MIPTMKIGDLEISRLIVGSNPLTGKSHLDNATSEDMKSHFTDENIFALLKRCEEVGINAYQSRGSLPAMGFIYNYNKNGGNMHWIATTGKNPITFDEELAELMKYEPAAVCLHGELCDDFYLTNRMELLKEHLDKIRATGLPVGICSHFPEVLLYAEENGLAPDFYMASMYNLFQPDRSNDLVKTGERFERSDVPIMYEAIRKLSAPTIALKVLGAGRRCGTQEEVKETIFEAFAFIKETDGILIGMFDKYIDQPALNAQYTVEAIEAAKK